MAVQAYKDFINNILTVRGRFGLSDTYHERHHILPRCLNGTDDEDNLIDLTPKEHFQAHRLLVEENPDNTSLMGALVMVAFMRSSNQERYVLTNEEYEYVKSINSKFVSLTQKDLHWCYEVTTHQIRRFKIDKIPNNYVLGLPPEYVGPTKGIRMSDKTKAKLSKSKKGKYVGKQWFNNGTIEILVYNCPEGFSNGRLPFSEEAKQNMSKSMIGKSLSAETREKLSKTKTGLHCYNNGKISVRAKECPEGFVPGLLTTKRPCKFYTNGKTNRKIYEGESIPSGFYPGITSDKFKGRHWYTNGIENKWALECPEGFYLGKTKK